MAVPVISAFLPALEHIENVNLLVDHDKKLSCVFIEPSSDDNLSSPEWKPWREGVNGAFGGGFNRDSAIG